MTSLFRACFVSFHVCSSLLAFVFYFFNLFHSCCSHAQLLRTALVYEFHITCRMLYIIIISPLVLGSSCVAYVETGHLYGSSGSSKRGTSLWTSRHRKNNDRSEPAVIGHIDVTSNGSPGPKNIDT